MCMYNFSVLTNIALRATRELQFMVCNKTEAKKHGLDDGRCARAERVAQPTEGLFRAGFFVGRDTTPIALLLRFCNFHKQDGCSKFTYFTVRYQRHV
jgi:hypothetical protein